MRVLTLLAAITLLTSCSIQKIALNVTTPMFANGVQALYAEPDLEIAEIAVASNLKLLEGFHLTDPENKDLLQLLTQGYASYSLAFLEQSAPKRASLFYLRSRDYGFELLEKTSAFKNGIPAKEADFIAQLQKIDDDDLPALFWTAFAWAGWVNLNRNDAQAVFDLTKVKAMMDRVIELDETFFFGAAHLFWGSIYGSIPKLLGGDPEKAKSHFERAEEISDGKFLVAQVYFAQYYAATTLNEELFDAKLNVVLDSEPDVLPGYELITSFAKRRASELMAQKDDIL